MIALHRKFAFYILDSIIWIGLCLIMVIMSIGMYIYEKLSMLFYVCAFISFFLFIFSIYHLINAIYDYNIRKKGYMGKAIIVNVYSYRFRFSPYDNIIIVYEYTDKNGCIVRTKENVSKLKCFFNKKNRIKVISNGKKALLDRTKYN